MKKKGGHIEVLDGFRALAIFLVIARHSMKPYWHDLSEPFLSIGSLELGHLFYNGWTGVDLFFVLSGFLITSQLLTNAFATREKRWEEILFFYKKRYFRIAPAYYLVLTLVAFGLFPPFPVEDAAGVWGWRYIYHLLFLNDYFPSDICFIFWTLAVEIKFYLLAPFMVMGLLRVRKTTNKVMIILALSALVILSRFLTALYISPSTEYAVYFQEIRSVFHLSLDGLFGGMICAYLWNDKTIRSKLFRPIVANGLFYSGTAIFLGISMQGNLVDIHAGIFDKTLLPFLLSLGFVLMLLGLLGECKGCRLFRGFFQRFTAKISYSLYLTHILLLVPATRIAAKIYDNASAAPLSWLAGFTVLFIISALFSTIIWNYVERPFIIWAKQSNNALPWKKAL